jgi:hypothetical protein
MEVVDYTVAPYLWKKEKPMNGWLNLKSSCRCITIQALDESIQSLNSDYEAKRYNNMTLNPLIINVARKICFTIG